MDKLEDSNGLKLWFLKTCEPKFCKVHFMSFVTFDMMSGRPICLMRSSDFVIHTLFIKVP